MSTMFKRRKPKIPHDALCEDLKQTIIALKIRVDNQRVLIKHLKKMSRNELILLVSRTRSKEILRTLRSEIVKAQRLDVILRGYKDRYRAAHGQLYKKFLARQEMLK